MHQVAQGVGHNGAGDDADEARHHERVVEQVFADDGGAASVEVHRGNITGIVGDEEIAVDRRQYAEQHPSLDAQRIGQRQHGHDNGTLRVDEHGNEEEGDGNGPRIGGYKVGQHGLHLAHVVAEIGVGQPGDAINGHHSHHAALPHRTGHGLLRLCLTEDNHQGCSRNHDNLDDDIHGQRFSVELGQQVAAKHLNEREHDDDAQGGQEDIDGAPRLRGNLLVERGGTAAIDVFILLGVFQASLELRVFVEVQTTAIAGQGGHHQTDETGRDGNHDDLQVVYLKAVCGRDGGECHHSSSDGRTGDAHL